VNLVFDNTPLSHFARAGRLDVLDKLTARYRRITPDQVITELLDGLNDHPALAVAVTAQWLEIVELRHIEEIVAFAKYKTELGGGVSKNNGEAAVLAYVATNGGVALIDERVGTRIAKRDLMEVHGTMWLVANGLRFRLLDRDAAESILDELAATDMALPVDGAGFVAWAYEEGLL
jgi:predicted nucleic acid-binding protein